MLRPMPEAIETDVAVVGGGPAGLVSACLAAKAGLRVCLVSGERAGEPPDPRTVALMRPAIRLLAHLGLAPETEAFGASPLWRLKLVDDTGSWLASPPIVFDAREIGDAPFGWNIPVAPLVDALERMAGEAGVDVMRNEARSLDGAGGAAVVTLRGGGTVRARIVIAADGSRSRLREQAGIEALTWAYGQDAITARFDHSGPHDDTSIEFHKPDGPLTTVPLGGARSSLVWMMRPERSFELVNLPAETFARVLQAELHGVLGRVSDVRGRHIFPMRGLAAVRLSAPRTLFVGEAGHVLPPIGAQGLNMSFRDAATAIELVTRARAAGEDTGGSGVTLRYDTLRRRDVATRQGIVHAVNWSLLSDWPLPHAARAMGLRAAAAIPALRQAIMRQGMGMSDDLPRTMRE